MSRLPVSSQRGDTTWGLFLLLVVVLLWVGSSLAVQIFLYTERKYDSPFALSLVNNYIANLLWALWAAKPVARPPTSEDSRELSPGTTASTEESQVLVVAAHSSGTALRGSEEPSISLKCCSHQKRALPLRVVWLSVAVAPLFLAGQWTFNAALLYTSVTASTLLSATSTLWTYFFTVILLQEQCRLLPLMASLLSFVGCGVVIVTQATSETDSSSEIPEAHTAILGNGLALTSAALFGLVTVLTKKHLKGDDEVDALFASMASLVTVTSPLLLLVGSAFSSGLVFELPEDSFGMFVLIGNGLLGSMLANYLWGIAVVLLSPLVANVCITMTIPLSMLCEGCILHTRSFGAVFVFGTSLVIMGVVLATATLDKETGPTTLPLLPDISAAVSLPTFSAGSGRQPMPHRRASDEDESFSCHVIGSPTSPARDSEALAGCFTSQSSNNSTVDNDPFAAAAAAPSGFGVAGLPHQRPSYDPGV